MTKAKENLRSFLPIIKVRFLDKERTSGPMAVNVQVLQVEPLGVQWLALAVDVLLDKLFPLL